jgi:hypothetical protein
LWINHEKLWCCLRRLDGRIYVTYPQQVAPANLVNANGARPRFDIYDTNGKLIEQLVAGGALNAPWRLAPAPAISVRSAMRFSLGIFPATRCSSRPESTAARMACTDQLI